MQPGHPAQRKFAVRLRAAALPPGVAQASRPSESPRPTPMWHGRPARESCTPAPPPCREITLLMRPADSAHPAPVFASQGCRSAWFPAARARAVPALCDASRWTLLSRWTRRPPSIPESERERKNPSSRKAKPTRAFCRGFVQPAARANGPKRPWLILNVGQVQVAIYGTGIILST